MKKKLQLIPFVSICVLSGAALSILTSCQFGKTDPKAADLSEVKTANLYTGTLSDDKTDIVTKSRGTLKYRTYEDIPYVSFSEVLNSLTGSDSYYSDFDDNVYTFELPSKEFTYTIAINVEKDTITFNSYEKLIQALSGASVINGLADTADKENSLIKTDMSKYKFTDPGSTTFSLAASNLDTIADGSDVYLPFSVIESTIFESLSSPFAFNGTDFYAAIGSFFVKPQKSSSGESVTSSYCKAYYSGAYSGSSKRSSTMAEYAYNSICFNFNNFYGFNDKYFKNSDFDTYLKANYSTVRDHLKSRDTRTYETGINELYITVFGDGHTSTGAYSSFYGDVNNVTRGSVQSSGRVRTLSNSYNELRASRINAFSGNVPGFSIQNKTAIIRIDSYDTNGAKITPQNASSLTSTETFAIFYSCFSQIQKHSEIENVVIDVTLNGGGAVDALIETMGFLTRDVKIYLDNPTTKSTTTFSYNVDTNLDGQFDDNDSFAGKYNFYALTSSYSFSCANLFPTICKTTGAAKIIGEKSGGGSCVVRNGVTADGMIVQMSGTERLNYEKDGKMIDNDGGIAPDYEYERANFYDNAKLAAFVESK